MGLKTSTTTRVLTARQVGFTDCGEGRDVYWVPASCTCYQEQCYGSYGSRKHFCLPPILVCLLLPVFVGSRGTNESDLTPHTTHYTLFILICHSTSSANDDDDRLNANVRFRKSKIQRMRPIIVSAGSVMGLPYPPQPNTRRA